MKINDSRRKYDAASYFSIGIIYLAILVISWRYAGDVSELITGLYSNNPWLLIWLSMSFLLSAIAGVGRLHESLIWGIVGVFSAFLLVAIELILIMIDLREMYESGRVWLPSVGFLFVIHLYLLRRFAIDQLLARGYSRR